MPGCSGKFKKLNSKLNYFFKSSAIKVCQFFELTLNQPLITDMTNFLWCGSDRTQNQT